MHVHTNVVGDSQPTVTEPTYTVTLLRSEIVLPMRIALLIASICVGQITCMGQITGSWDADAKAMAQALVSGLEKCPPRVVVANFGKDGWTKATWGPPTNLDYDVLRTNSVKWPYHNVISYRILVSGTKNRKNREEAEQDVKPSLVFKSSATRTPMTLEMMAASAFRRLQINNSSTVSVGSSALSCRMHVGTTFRGRTSYKNPSHKI